MTVLWNIHKLEVSPTLGNYANVVSIIHWTAHARENGNSAHEIGETRLDSPTEPYTIYENITQEQAVIWLHDKLGAEVANLETRVMQKLDAINNPPLVSPKLPWLP